MPGSATTHTHVQRMLDLIHQNYAQRLTLTILAGTLQRQSAYLGRLFRNETGVTVHEYVTRARMWFGAAQVRSGVKIEAIALDLGYRSKKNFYRQFKRRFGMTPQRYRHCSADASEDMSISAHSHRNQSGRLRSVASRQHRDLIPSDTLGRTTRTVVPPSLSQRMVRALLEQRVAIIVSDGTGHCVAANQAAISVTGYSVDELRGMPVEILFRDGVGSDTGPRLQVLFPASASLPSNAVLRTKSAASIPVHITTADNVLGTSTTRGTGQASSPSAHVKW
jgi:AraC-like DNA-binding protein